MFIDSHAHLFYSNYDSDLDDVIDRAEKNGVSFIIIPSTDLNTAEQVLKLVDKYDLIYGAVGVHPHETKNWDPSFIPKLEKLAHHKKIVAIGEIGLDYYYDYSPSDKQIEAFRAQIDLALKLNMPVIVHNRDSDKDMMEIIGSYCSRGLKAHFHCFNGSIEDGMELIGMNHMLSFPGNITFKKSDSLRKIAEQLPMDHLLIETDSPFMTPEPYRGKRNEPANVRLVAEKLAELHNIRVEDVARITSYNNFRMFGIGSGPVFTYKLGDSLYINVTNRCNAKCVFCRRKGEAILKGYNLKMNKTEEPDVVTYIREIGDPKKFKEIVFCGYGEPTIRWDVVKAVAKYVKKNGGRTRINTNGHGNYINKKDITPEFKNVIDVVSISLNSIEPKQYSQITGLETRMFNEMIQFATLVRPKVEKVVMSIVSLKEVEISKARKLVEEKIGAEFRVREYF